MVDVVAIVAILTGLGLPTAALVLYLVLNYRKRLRLMELHHAERMAAIERGMELPPLPIELIEGSRRRTTSLLPGLVWFFIGIGVMIAMRATGESEGMIGLVPAGVGLAYLIYYFAEGRKIEARLLEHDLAKPEEMKC
jgi:hypothetical protein